MAKSREELMEVRKQMLPTATAFSPRDSLSKLSSPLGLPKELAEMEQKLHETWSSEEDSLFYYHRTEDRIVLSHAMFWTMTQPQFFKSKMRKEKFFLLLRQYEEEMLDAFLQDDDYFSELLHYCNILYEMLPTILMASHLRTEKDARKLAAIAMVAAGYAGDMDEELANELLDDIDYLFDKVKCRKIELMMPKLMTMVESEMERMRR
jgi:hypothetical protein